MVAVMARLFTAKVTEGGATEAVHCITGISKTTLDFAIRIRALLPLFALGGLIESRRLSVILGVSASVRFRR